MQRSFFHAKDDLCIFLFEPITKISQLMPLAEFSVPANKIDFPANEALHHVIAAANLPQLGEDLKSLYTAPQTFAYKVVFHSFRHSSITYKLKLNGGDIKAVQGDSGHAQASMVTEQYAHILDDDRRFNAQRFDDFFYQHHGAEPEMPHHAEQPAPETSAVDTDAAAALAKLLADPSMAALIKNLAKNL